MVQSAVEEKLATPVTAAASEQAKVAEVKNNIMIEVVKKTKKNHPKYFRALSQIDRDAFDKHGDSGMIIKTFWNSNVNKIIVAKKIDTQAIIGYAAFLVQDPPKEYVQKQRQLQRKHHIKVPQGSYLMRIGVRAKCQRQGIGRKLMDYLLTNFPAHLTLDVSTDNAKATSFYKRLGLVVERTYLTEEDQVEFAAFSTPEDFVYAGMNEPTKVKEETKQSEQEAKNIVDDKIFGTTSAASECLSATVIRGSISDGINSDEETSSSSEQNISTTKA